ncbi:GNAT family N-acetyltransferase [Sinorhizobium meliloti]|uniref:GNAT family N-acetyltransferase n=1 Tax=Rhizobium meliloti TaxID=382 RepID=UPI001F39BEA2|nr:GNAT family N-acetyltransferase [Sinorhizobium meliloti]
MKSPSQIADSESDQHTAEVPYRVHFYENCSQSPAWQLVQHAMIERGFRGPADTSAMFFTEPCVVAIDENGKAIALLIYDCGPAQWEITLSYEGPEHRRKGTYTALFTALVGKATKQEDVFSIYSRTYPNYLAALEAQGRARESINSSFHLKDWGDGKEPTESAVAQSRGRSFEEMPEYLVEPFDTGPDGLKSMQAFINEKAAEGYALHQVVRESTYQWVLIFRKA